MLLGFIPQVNPGLAADWMPRWEKYILAESKDRYCDREMGEELGWLVSPFLNGFAYGYLATNDTQWLDRLVDWTDSWIKRGIKEPDGFIGWPKAGSGGVLEEGLYTDSLLGEAMAFRSVAMIQPVIQRNPELKKKYGGKFNGYMAVAIADFKKWDSRGCWRSVGKDGGIWVVPGFGIDQKTGKWTPGYALRDSDGFSNPANKENAIAMWETAMYDATHDRIYRDRAAKWMLVMKSRMKIAQGGTAVVWNYWDPAGPWDYKPDHTTKHWVGVHPNGGYYGIDVDAIVDAYTRGFVFSRGDIDFLVATNKDFMWDHHVSNASFKRIDGGEPDPRWKNTPGVLWSALAPYDNTLQAVFEANFKPDSWGGLAGTPAYFVALAKNAK